MDQRTTEFRRSMIRDAHEWLHDAAGVVCEVGRGHVGTGRLHIDLPGGALRHLASQVHDMDVDFDTGRAWCPTAMVARVRDLAEALGSAR